MSVTDLPRSSSLSETRENGRIAGLEVSDNQERIAPDGGFKRRARLTRDIIERAGITEAMIEGLVKEFYGHIQVDALLGPIFAVRIADWEAHITKLCAFWSSVALMSGRYPGQPMQAHLELPVTHILISRWVCSSARQRSCVPKCCRAFY